MGSLELAERSNLLFLVIGRLLVSRSYTSGLYPKPRGFMNRYTLTGPG